MMSKKKNKTKKNKTQVINKGSKKIVLNAKKFQKTTYIAQVLKTRLEYASK